MVIGLIQSILILPGTVLVFIPIFLLWVSRQTNLFTRLSRPDEFQFWAAVFLFLVGFVLTIWTVRLQFRVGQGTPAPWDPPIRLVVQGPYRYVRNPMITGVFCLLLGESLLFRSWLLAGWWFIFVLGNLIYMPLVEEVDLEERFGKSYLLYKNNVPRWIPRRTPWTDREM